jgi:hypothetical protein
MAQLEFTVPVRRCYNHIWNCEELAASEAFATADQRTNESLRKAFRIPVFRGSVNALTEAQKPCLGKFYAHLRPDQT